MSEHFDTRWHDATRIIQEALREYVGDGEGEDQRVLAAHDAEVERKAKAEAWDEGYRTADQVWIETADITTPDEYRTDHTNPHRQEGDR